MLILTRNPGESIKIGDDITVAVKKIADKKVVLTVSDASEWTITLGCNQSVMITDNIKITATLIRSQVKLGIDAPTEVRIMREEIQ